MRDATCFMFAEVREKDLLRAVLSDDGTPSSSRASADGLRRGRFLLSAHGVSIYNLC